jgi:uncharacterized Fe-S cluster protein YjdI/CDGSH-type Zn-finger protein
LPPDKEERAMPGPTRQRSDLELMREANEARMRPGVQRRYANDRVAVTWEPSLCIHTGNCFRRLGEVFDPWARPWVDIDGADPDHIARAVLSCPTGALHYERLDGGPQETAGAEATLNERPEGPLYVRGSIRLVGEDGTVIREDTRMALCRCGRSDNQPFCDGSHRLPG